MSLSTTPDLPLLRILYYIPLEDLLSRVNLVCRRWAVMKREACAQRRSLTLLIGDDNIQRKSLLYDAFAIPLPNDNHINGNRDIKSSWSRVELNELTSEKVAQLAQQLPNIVSLILIHEAACSRDLRHQLKNCWPDKLVSLKLLSPQSKSLTEQHYNSASVDIWIHSHSKLKHFTMIYNGNFDVGVFKNHVLGLGFFSHLEEVCFGVDGGEVCDFHEVNNNKHHDLKRIALFNFPSKYKLTKLSSFESTLAAKFTHLTFDAFPRDVNLAQFVNVTTVLLTKLNYKIPISLYFSRLLLHFPLLAHLTLYIDVEQLSKDNLPTARTMTQLACVKVLSLHLLNCSRMRHSHLDRCFSLISKFVPTLRVLSIRMDSNFGCEDCGIVAQGEDEEEGNIPYDHFTNCVRECIRPLSNFRDSQLHLPLDRIETSYSKLAFYREWTVDELV